MSPLETRYRRLLGAYPAEHRRVYADEMLGVLLAGARPGQRRPGLREAADLLWSGMRTRAGHGARALRGPGWRDAAGVTALLGAALLTAAAARRLVSALILTQETPHVPAAGLLSDVAARTAVWLAVLIAVAAGLRRTAAALGIGGLIVEIAAIVAWLPGEPLRPIRMSWAPMLAALVAAMLLLARRGRPPARVLGTAGTLLTLTPAAMALWGAIVTLSAAPRALIGSLATTQILGLVTVRDALLVTAAALVIAGLRHAEPSVRGRLAVLLAPLVAIPAAQQLMEFLVGLRYGPDLTVGLVTADVLFLTGVPLLAASAAATVRHGQKSFTITVRRRDG
ncbi:hypothetical protein [Actinoplanes sp. NPDC049681]|uniref:hypothetical protein n=1 Tax=Actinoplanes sp. NPDC049681 TaxID=3363905 RepID=UPI0037A292D5